MTKIYKDWLNNTQYECLPLETLITLHCPNATNNFRKTVLILSDSQCKYVLSIYNGDVITISGATYKTLARYIYENSINIQDYKYILIHCGINMCRYYEPSKWGQHWHALANALEPAIKK